MQPQPPQQSSAHAIARQCSEALDSVTFPDLATRKLFEGLIAQASSVETANAAAEQTLF